MAMFCLETGYTPEQYRQMTVEEVSAFIEVIERKYK
jgi:hypothetical protein